MMDEEEATAVEEEARVEEAVDLDFDECVDACVGDDGETERFLVQPYM
jgi:hypothetical protein